MKITTLVFHSPKRKLREKSFHNVVLLKSHSLNNFSSIIINLNYTHTHTHEKLCNLMLVDFPSHGVLLTFLM